MSILSLLDEEIDNLKKQKEEIIKMKKGAMQKLLSGEVRLLEQIASAYGKPLC